MKCYQKLPEGTYPHNHGYYLSTNLIWYPTDEIMLQVFGANKQYKLHFNMTDKSYVAYGAKIVESIQKHGLDNGVIGFKHFMLTEATLEQYESYKLITRCTKALREIYLHHHHKPDDKTNYHAKALKLLNKIPKDAAILTPLSKHLNQGITAKEYDEFRSYFNHLVDSYNRYIGQAQFTIYLCEPIDPNKIANFCRLINADFQGLNLSEGRHEDTGLPVIGDSHLITFRQQSFNNDPTNYIHPVQEDAATRVAHNQRLDREARESQIYKSLITALNADEKHSKVQTQTDTTAATDMTTATGNTLTAANSAATFKSKESPKQNPDQSSPSNSPKQSLS